MIKIIYEQKSYHYECSGNQDYDVNTEMLLNEDITSTNAILAFMKILQIATYRVDGDTLREAAAICDMEKWEG